jgi:hypothetical protein
MEELSLVGLDDCDLLSVSGSLDPFDVDFSVPETACATSASAAEAELWQSAFAVDVANPVSAASPSVTVVTVNNPYPLGSDVHGGDGALQNIQLDVFPFAADPSLPDVPASQDGDFNGDDNASFTEFTRGLDVDSDHRDHSLGLEFEQPPGHVMQENRNPKANMNANPVTLSKNASCGIDSCGGKRPRVRSAATNKSTVVPDADAIVTAAKNPVALHCKLRNEESTNVSPVTPVRASKRSDDDERRDEEELLGLSTSCGVGGAKPRDKSTQRKLRNKESARRYREKQVAKRRQLEDYTRSLAEQNRELESLHEKLLSMTFGPGNVGLPLN